MKIGVSGKILLVVVVILCAAALVCAPASAWHSTTDANITPSGVLMPGDAVSANITITYLRDTTVYRLPLSTDLAGQVWTEKLTRDDGTPITEFPPGKRFIDGYTLTKLPYEVILTIHLEGTVPENSVGNKITILKVEEMTSGGIVVSSYETPKIVVGSSTPVTASPSVTPTVTTTATPTATTVPTVTPTPVTATLVAASVPAGADLFIDNIYRGLTPLVCSDITPGSHHILLKREGYADDHQTVVFAAGTTYEISFSLSEKQKPAKVVADLIRTYPTAFLIGVLFVGMGILVLLIRRRC